MPFVYRFDPEREIDRITGDRLSLTVRRLGAEVIGLTHHHDHEGDVGLLWRNDELDDPPRYWKGHATILFPIVGHIHNLTGTTRDGDTVRFAKQHGFVRHRKLQLLGHGGTAEKYVLNYHLLADDETRSMYPWEFELSVRYELRDNALHQRLTVTNRDARMMPFQIGWHPGFAAPFRKGEKSAMHLRLPNGPIVRRLNDEHCHLTGETQNIDAAGDFTFTEQALDATYMFDWSAVPPAERVVELLDPDEAFGVRLVAPDYPHLGLWSDAEAPFLCLEPWQGMDDAVEQEPFDAKFGIVHLPPEQTRVFHAAIEIVDNRT